MAKTPKPPKDKVEDTVENAVVVDERAPEEASVGPADMTPDDNPDGADTALSEATDEQTDVEAAAGDAGLREAREVPQGMAPPENAQRSGFVPLVLGGVIAAVIGFGAARYVVPEGWPFPGVAPEVDPIAQAVAAQAGRLNALETANDETATAVAGLQADDGLVTLRGEVNGEFKTIVAQIEAVSTRIDEIEARLLAVEKLPTGAGAEAAVAAAAAYERELEQMRAMLDRELERISTVQEDAQTLEVSAAEAAKAAAGRAALSRIMAALDTGRAFDDALFDLGEATGLDAPAALAGLAKEGVPTLATLQADFPDAARASLEASIRAAVEDGSMDRMTAFLRTQLGVRSLEPKEGDDPDAILSRAEHALKTGDIAGALTELAAMPEAGQPALTDWIATATARLDALEASSALAAHVNES
ncbi:hypothetical protein [Aliiroseovarius subalbicans]|uniref:COG4223 family protein n=1 Tax=Aliiroseovarius subalbicans TaxID=2925840 RepID=UPI001F5A7AAB|nr:hypothetical protein [Aliiroseovarius subalbicans]MCI2400010.1 hypothetical protein [Aliiroseovarius subalbicans]